MYVVFFFFKQKTAYEMRISDWSSDVCSSDLGQHRRRPHHHRGEGLRQPAEDRQDDEVHRRVEAGRGTLQGPGPLFHGLLLGRGRVCDPTGSRDRKSVVSGKSVSVRVDLGGRRIIKKKNQTTT